MDVRKGVEFVIRDARPDDVEAGVPVVAEQRSDRGIGRRLIEAVETEARARGCFGVMLTSGNWCDDAHAFDRERRYLETGRRFVKEFT